MSIGQVILLVFLLLLYNNAIWFLYHNRGDKEGVVDGAKFVSAIIVFFGSLLLMFSFALIIKSFW